MLTKPDGPLTVQIAETLTEGAIHGIDSSESMIQTAKTLAAKASLSNATFQVVDANALQSASLPPASYDKVFSNAAMHWILKHPSRKTFFTSLYELLKPSGTFVFEMGGMGNVAEMRTVFLYMLSKRIGIEKAREVDPWFFPDVKWMEDMLVSAGFAVEECELEYRPTRMETGSGGGIEGWVRLMGKQFFDAVGESEREEAVQEVVETLKTVCTIPSGGEMIGYVRLRAKARKA